MLSIYTWLTWIKPCHSQRSIDHRRLASFQLCLWFCKCCEWTKECLCFVCSPWLSLQPVRKLLVLTHSRRWLLQQNVHLPTSGCQLHFQSLSHLLRAMASSPRAREVYLESSASPSPKHQDRYVKQMKKNFTSTLGRQLPQEFRRSVRSPAVLLRYGTSDELWLLLWLISCFWKATLTTWHGTVCVYSHLDSLIWNILYMYVYMYVAGWIKIVIF